MHVKVICYVLYIVLKCTNSLSPRFAEMYNANMLFRRLGWCPKLSAHEDLKAAAYGSSLPHQDKKISQSLFFSLESYHRRHYHIIQLFSQDVSSSS